MVQETMPCGKHDPRLIFAWPSAELRMGGTQAAKVWPKSKPLP
jgi:acetyl-CoA carboxylase carboxyltransferase component